LFVIDAEKCFGPTPPRETVLKNGDSTAKDALYTCLPVLYTKHFVLWVTILQYGLPWRRRAETLSRVNYKQTLRVLQTIVVYRVIVGSLVISL
jgi:hypothetical protein